MQNVQLEKQFYAHLFFSLCTEPSAMLGLLAVAWLANILGCDASMESKALQQQPQIFFLEHVCIDMIKVWFGL